MQNESEVEVKDPEARFDKIIRSISSVQGKPYSSLGNQFYGKMDDKLAKILPVYALGHRNAEIRKLAKKLFEALCIIGRTA
jgi:hypothetical protein